MTKSILDPEFEYVHSSKSTADRLRERFKEIRGQIEADMKAKESKIKPLIKIKRSA